MTPIIYIRGYAGTSSAVERAVESTYYGFNDGSTKVRVDAKGQPGLHLFESPLVRLMKDHDYRDYLVRVEGGRLVLQTRWLRAIWCSKLVPSNRHGKIRKIVWSE